MKTAMQQLQEKVLRRSCNLPEKESLIRAGELNMVLNDIKELLEEEKEQIINAYANGTNHYSGDDADSIDVKFGDLYFRQMFY